MRFDTRTRAPGSTLLSGVYAKSSNSITYLNVIKNWQLLVSTIRGTVRWEFRSCSPGEGYSPLSPIR